MKKRLLRLEPRYYFRLDDAHSAMNSKPWSRVEAVLDKHSVRPIVAVIPDNKDQSLCHGQPDGKFWDKVRQWQVKGWHVGVHGLTHELRAGNGGLLGINSYGEMAGLSEAEQVQRLRRAIEIFAQQGIRSRVFVAPAHAFDRATLRALAAVGMEMVSDGLDIQPYVYDGLVFIPQQLWRPRTMPFGTWTICLHPSGMTVDDLDALDQFLAENGDFCPPDLPRRPPGGWRSPSRTIASLLKALFWMKKAVRSAAHATHMLV